MIWHARRCYGELLGLPRSPHDADEFQAGNVTLSLSAPALDGEQLVPTAPASPCEYPTSRRHAPRSRPRACPLQGETVDTGIRHMALARDPDGNVPILHPRYAPHTHR